MDVMQVDGGQQGLAAVVEENERRKAARLEEMAQAVREREVPLPGESAAVRRERCRRDFAYWAETCARIKDKVSGRMVPFRLNRPQRRVAALLERERMAGRPIRMIMLKARQWGGSTLYYLLIYLN